MIYTITLAAFALLGTAHSAKSPSGIKQDLGMAQKRGGNWTGYNNRRWILEGMSLSYYKKEVKKDSIDLEQVTAIDLDPEDDCCLTIATPLRQTSNKKHQGKYFLKFSDKNKRYTFFRKVTKSILDNTTAEPTESKQGVKDLLTTIANPKRANGMITIDHELMRYELCRQGKGVFRNVKFWKVLIESVEEHKYKHTTVRSIRNAFIRSIGSMARDGGCQTTGIILKTVLEAEMNIAKGGHDLNERVRSEKSWIKPMVLQFLDLDGTTNVKRKELRKAFPSLVKFINAFVTSRNPISTDRHMLFNHYKEPHKEVVLKMFAQLLQNLVCDLEVDIATMSNTKFGLSANSFAKIIDGVLSNRTSIQTKNQILDQIFSGCINDRVKKFIDLNLSRVPLQGFQTHIGWFKKLEEPKETMDTITKIQLETLFEALLTLRSREKQEIDNAKLLIKYPMTQDKWMQLHDRMINIVNLLIRRTTPSTAEDEQKLNDGRRRMMHLKVQETI